MTAEGMVDRLVADLAPVRRRSVRVDAVLLAVLAVVELALFIGIGAARPDMPRAMDHMSFWWKLGSLGALALIGVPASLVAFDPTRSPRRALRWLLVAVALSLAIGWLLDAADGSTATLVARLAPANGLTCTWKMVSLSLPPLAALGLLMRRGAPTDPGPTAALVGLSAASWGAFVFVFACPVDDPLYIAVWYAVGCGLVTAVARIVLPPLTRW